MYPSVLIVSGRISSNWGHSMARGEVSHQIVGISSICFFNIFCSFNSFNIWILLLMVTHLSLIFLCCVVTYTHTHTHTHICGYLKYDYWAQSLSGLTIYLYRGFWLSYYGWIYTRQPKYPPISSDPSQLLELIPFSRRMIDLFSQCSLQNCQPPFLP